MNGPRSLLSGVDFPALAATALLVLIGILSIFSSGVNSEGTVVSGDYLKQIFWAVTGLALLVILVLVDYRQIKDYAPLIYGLLVVLLVYTRLFGRVVNGARAWIGIGDLGVQPSEFAKIAVILFLARYLEGSVHDSHLRRIAASFGIVLLPMALILSQPDFGTALVFIPILFFMLFVAGIDRKYLLFLFLVCLLAGGLTILPLWEKFILDRPTRVLKVLYEAPYSWSILLALAALFGLALWGFLSFKKRYYWWISFVFLAATTGQGLALLAHKVLKEYQVMRLIVFMDPSIDPRGSGWNILQSITAIGSGGFAGRGFLQGPQSHNRYIPQQSTDFIFSIIAEEWGFLGGILVFGLFLVLLQRCTVIMRSSRDDFALYITSGIMGMIFFHFMINTGMAMGIMPITGIPLFFLSYGGSSLLAVLSSIGLLLGISARRYGS